MRRIFLRRENGRPAKHHLFGLLGSIVISTLAATTLDAQIDTTRADSTFRMRGKAPAHDTLGVQGGIYSRPYITGIGNTSIGGYAEGNTNYFVEDGVSGDGFSMEMRRFNIFLYSAIGPRLRFTSELEFEHGTEEIALETALLDFQFNPAFVLRAGILLVPIGGFNQNHDSPRWEFIDRPLVSTTIIPSTLSDIGFGALGRIPLKGLTLTYDFAATNGLGDGVVLNGTGRTSLPDGKDEERLAEDNNGSPALAGRVAVQRRGLGELGISYYGGIYNSYSAEGTEVDQARRLSISAVDFSTGVGPLSLRGEAAMTRVDLPCGLMDFLGDKQYGMHLDAVVPVWRPNFPGLRNATVNAALRVEYVDYNVGTFNVTNTIKRDDVTAIVPGLSFRPSASTVFKINYRREWHRDLVGNPPTRVGGYQVGFATYF